MWELTYGYEKAKQFADNYDEYSQYHIEYYSVSKEAFRGFIKKPNMEILQTGQRYTYTYLNADEGFSCDYYFGAITSDNISFYCNENIENILMKNGVNEKVEAYTLLSTSLEENSEIPVTLWVRTTENNNYFIELGCQSGVIQMDRSVFSTYSQYYEKYRQHSGKVFINGSELKGAEYVKFEGRSVLLPFRDVMEVMGSNVVWDKASGNILFDVKGENYTWIKKYLPRVVSGNEVVLDFFYSTENYKGKTIISDLRLKDLVALYGGSVDIDYDNYCVYVNI